MSSQVVGFEQLKLFSKIKTTEQSFILDLCENYRMSFQQVRILVSAARDFEMSQTDSLQKRWSAWELLVRKDLPQIERRKRLLDMFSTTMDLFRTEQKAYPQDGLSKPKRKPIQIQVKDTPKKIMGDCPVASPKTVCCNLKTIDAVESCAYGCSYCTIETFYGDKVVFDKNFKEKLSKIEIDPNKFYHIGTGQSSDSLVWGNREGILDHLCDFAEKNPNILLEFKTKSSNITYFLENETPPNIVCSWSLNTETIAKNEEHFTVSTAKRLDAARQVADKGIKVAFHFHPMVYYKGWQEEYTALIKQVLDKFDSEEILFISFGTVTLIKPVLQKIRERGEPTKILQMDLVPDPHGKLTYSDSIKLELFHLAYQTFMPWHGKVLFYLCMERAFFWDEVFGWHYPTNEAFEQDFGRQTMSKIGSANLL